MYPSIMRALAAVLVLSGSAVTAQMRLIAHVTRDGAGFETKIVLENEAADAQTFTLTPYDAAGNRGTEVTASLNSLTGMAVSATELFPEMPEVSHFQVAGNDIRVTAAYRAADGGGSPAHVGENKAQAGRYRLFHGDWTRVFDGFAAVNTGDLPTDVWVTQIGFDGEVIHSLKALTALSPMAKGLFVIGSPDGSLFADTEDSFFEIHADQSLAITALRGSLPGSEFLWVNPLEQARPAITKVTNDAGSDQACSSPFLLTRNAPDVNNMPQGEVWVDVSDDGRLAAAAKDYRYSPLTDTIYNNRVWNGLYLSNDQGSTWKNYMFENSDPNAGIVGITGSNYGQVPDREVLLDHQSDPALGFDRDGNVYTCGLAFKPSNGGPFDYGNGHGAIVVSRWNPDGRLAPGTTHFLGLEADGTLFNDKNWLAVDRSEPTESTVVAATWRLIAFGSTPTLEEGSFVAVSADGAATFSDPIRMPIPEPESSSNQFIQPLIGPDAQSGRKTLYILFRTINPDDFTMAMHLLKADIDGLPAGTQALQDHLSNPDNWTYLPNRLSGLFFYGSDGWTGSFRFSSFFMPAIDRDSGHLYMAAEVFEPVTQGSRVMVSRSTNGGSIWTTPREVDYPRYGHQIMPAVAVHGGVVSVVWYDTRHEEGEFMPFSRISGVDVYYAELDPSLVTRRVLRLTKQTQAVGPVFTLPMPQQKTGDIRVYPHDLTLFPLLPNSLIWPRQGDERRLAKAPEDCDGYGFIGDYIGIAADGEYAYAVWCDMRDVDRNSEVCDGHDCGGRRNQNIYFARIRKLPPETLNKEGVNP